MSFHLLGRYYTRSSGSSSVVFTGLVFGLLSIEVVVTLFSSSSLPSLPSFPLLPLLPLLLPLPTLLRLPAPRPGGAFLSF